MLDQTASHWIVHNVFHHALDLLLRAQEVISESPRQVGAAFDSSAPPPAGQILELADEGDHVASPDLSVKMWTWSGITQKPSAFGGRTAVLSACERNIWIAQEAKAGSAKTRFRPWIAKVTEQMLPNCT